MKVSIIERSIDREAVNEAIRKFNEVMDYAPILLMNQESIKSLFDGKNGLSKEEGYYYNNHTVYLDNKLEFGEIELR